MSELDASNLGAERRANVEARVEKLEKTVFGHHNESRNAYVDGLLQMTQNTGEDVAAMRAAQDRFYTYAGRYAFAVLAGLVAILTHQYGILDAVAKAWGIR
jgi:hypothetical protein